MKCYNVWKQLVWIHCNVIPGLVERSLHNTAHKTDLINSPTIWCKMENWYDSQFFHLVYSLYWYISMLGYPYMCLLFVYTWVHKFLNNSLSSCLLHSRCLFCIFSSRPRKCFLCRLKRLNVQRLLMPLERVVSFISACLGLISENGVGHVFVLLQETAGERPVYKGDSSLYIW